MILKPGPNAPPHFFLLSYRAEPGQAQTVPEQVGTFVARSVIRFDGSAGDAGEVRQEDEPFPGDGPVRYEAELAPWKPEPDVVVVDDDLADILDPPELTDAEHVDEHITAEPFGTLAVDRGSGFGPEIARTFGWFAKGKNPRLPLAGDVASFDPVAHPEQKLPDGFDNAFHNGHALPGAAVFDPGARLRFTDLAGPVRIATVPSAPVLTVSKDGAPIEPPLSLAPRVDTIVMDRGAAEFTFVWRATFPWEARFEGAELGVD